MNRFLQWVLMCFAVSGFALAQNPSIGSVKVANLTSTSATITFSTGAPVYAGVSYAYAGGPWSTVNDVSGATHSVVLSGLTPGKEYSYTPWFSGAIGLPSYTFTTPSGGPAISGVQVTNLTATTATVVFSTGISIFAGVSYAGPNGSWITVNDATAVNHSVTLTGLTPGAQYSYLPWYSGASGLPGYSFTTPSAGPSISNVQATNITSTSATITFSTGVAVFAGTSYAGPNGSWATVNETTAVNHTVQLRGLTAGTQYKYVPWYSGGVNFPAYTFSTLAAATSTSPLIPPIGAATTNIDISNTQIQSGMKRVGMNIEGQDFYDSGQMLRNLVFRNPGFEGETWQSILHCASASSGSCTDSNGWTQWPANFLKGASIQFISGSANGQSGTVTASTAANSGSNTGMTVNFSGLSGSPGAGDFAVVKMTVPGNASAGWWPYTSGGASIGTDTNDLSSNTPGKQALSLNATTSGQTARVDSYFDTTNKHNFILMNGSYELTFRAKGVGGNDQMTVSMGRQVANGSYLNQTITLSPSWQNYTLTFSATESSTTPVGTLDLRFQVSGASAYLDDVSLTPTTAAAGNTTAFRDEVVNTLQTLHPGVLRYMDDAGPAFGSSIDNMLATPFARQRSGSSEASAEEDDIPLGLHEFLQLCQAVGAEPWYVLPPAISAAEMQNLVQYLGGSASTPYGAIRANLGQSAPWTSVFPTIHLELGNEQWNNVTFPGNSINDPVAYGKRVATIFGAAKGASGYAANRFDLVMGSFVVNSWLTGQEAANASNYDSISVAPYMFGSFNDTSSSEAIFGPMFAEPEMWDSSATGYMYLQAQAVKGIGKKLVVYEENLSTQSGSASQDTVNAVVPSIAGGVTMADHMLLQMRDLGITTQNIWSLPSYNNQFTNPSGSAETSPVFGTVIDMGGQSDLRRPVFLAGQLVNMAVLPNMVQASVTGSNPTWNQPLSTNDNVQLIGAHYLQTFAFSDGASKHSLVVVNLSRTNAITTTFSGANAPTGSVTVSQLTSANLTDNNESSATVGIKTSTQNGFNPGAAYSLPAFSVTVFQWQQ